MSETISVANAARYLGRSKAHVHQLAKMLGWVVERPGPPHPSLLDRAAVLAYASQHRTSRSQPLDPETPAELQEAADGAHALLLLDAARQYGLLSGGPIIDIERCQYILALAAAQHIYPADDAAERIAAELLQSLT